MVLKSRFLFCFFLLAFLFPSQLAAQNEDITSMMEKHRNRRLSLRLSLGSANQLSINNEGDAYLNSSRSLNYSGELGYSEPLWHQLSIGFGVGVASVPYNFNFRIYKDPGDPDKGYYDLDNTEYEAHDFYLFVHLSYSFFLKKNLYLGLNAGTQLNYLPRYGISTGYTYIEEPSGSEVEVFNMRMEYTVAPKLFFSFRSNVFLEYAVHPNHLLLFGITMHYYPHSVATGEFLFNEELYNSKGSVTLGMNYLGLQLGYSYRF